MFTRLDGRLEVQRAETGWCGENHEVHAAFQNFFVCIQPDKFAFLIDVDFAFTALADIREAAIEPVTEDLAHGVEFHVAISG